MLQNQFSAEFGHGSGAQFNTIIRGGGNQIHGTLYEYMMNRNLNAVDESAARQGIRSNPRFDSNILGGSVGGPIVKDKLFYYSLFQYNPTGQASTPSSAVFSPTAAGYNQLSQIVGLSQTNLRVLKTYLAPAPAASAHNHSRGTGDPHRNAADRAAELFERLFVAQQSGLRDIRQGSDSRPLYLHEQRWIQLRHAAHTPVVFPRRKHSTAFALAGRVPHLFTQDLLNEMRAGFTRNDDGVPAGNYKFPGLDAFPNHRDTERFECPDRSVSSGSATTGSKRRTS